MRTLTEIQDPQQARQMNELYQRDDYTWAMQQADALRRRDFARVDWENVIEEIEDVGQRHEDSLRSQYARAIQHLLKLQVDSSNLPRRGWRRSLDNARNEIKKVLRNHPGLKSAREEVFSQAWRDARDDAVNAFTRYETENIEDPQALVREQKKARRQWSEALPRECPYTRQQVEDIDWLPEQSSLARPSARVLGDVRENA